MVLMASTSIGNIPSAVACPATPIGPEDADNYVLLLEELRAQLGRGCSTRWYAIPADDRIACGI